MALLAQNGDDPRHFGQLAQRPPLEEPRFAISSLKNALICPENLALNPGTLLFETVAD